MTISAINTHGGLANQPESPVRFNTNAVARAPRMPNSTMGRSGEKIDAHQGKFMRHATSLQHAEKRSSISSLIKIIQ